MPVGCAAEERSSVNHHPVESEWYSDLKLVFPFTGTSFALLPIMTLRLDLHTLLNCPYDHTCMLR